MVYVLMVGTPDESGPERVNFINILCKASRPVFLNLFKLTAHFASKKFGSTTKTSKILQITSKNSFLTLNKPKLAMCIQSI